MCPHIWWRCCFTELVEVSLHPPIVVVDPVRPAVRFQCEASGLPKPTVTWSKYDGTDIHADHTIFFFPGGEVIINGITGQNALKYVGIYVCNATNGHQSAVAYQLSKY